METSLDKGLTVVLGPANAGKMGNVLKWWHERLSRSPVIVVPTGPDARQMTGEMARRNGCVVGQSPALTFDGLVRLLSPDPPRYATELECMLIAVRILQETSLEALDPAAHLPGVARALVSLLQQLGESGRRPEELDHILARWAFEPQTDRLARDVRRLAAAYTRGCGDRGVIDRSTGVREAIGLAEGWTRPVAFYGFTSFTPGQRALVAALSRRVEVLMTFTHDSSRSVNLSPDDEIAWWKGQAVQVVDVTQATLAYDSPAIAFLERYLMHDGPRAEPPPASAPPGGVRFLLASGRRAEAELAAQEIAGLLRKGFRPADIAVIVRNVGAWSSLLEHVFASCGIPHQIDERRVLRETGMGHAFLSVLRGVALDDAHSIFAYLRSPYSGIAREAVNDLELRYRRGTATGARVLGDLAQERGLGEVERLWSLMEEGDGAPGAAPGRANVQSVVPGPVCARFQPEAAGALAQEMLSAGLTGGLVGSREMQEDAQAFRALQGALSTMLHAAPGEDGRGLDPRLALQLLAEVAVPRGRTADGEAVQVLSAQRARARRFKAVFMLGLVQGEFPGRPGRVSLLSASQRARLDAIGEGLFDPEPDEEAALFVSAVSRASQVLYLSARDAEDDGGDATPSYFWGSAKQLLGVENDEHSSRTLAELVFAPETAPSPRHYLRACVARGSVGDSSGAGLGVTVRPWHRLPARLVAPEVLAALQAMECFSPSALEAYVDCPFRWFVERVVGTEDLDLELDNRVAGQLLHRALSIVYTELASAGVLPLRANDVPMAERIAARVIDGLVAGEECPGSPGERRLAGRRLRLMARNLFHMEASSGTTLVMSQAEMWVGGEGGVDIGGLKLRGRIDRVDVEPETGSLYVFDYKTGSIPSKSAIGTGEALQLPLYLMALEAGRAGAAVGGGAYLGLSTKTRSGVVRAGSEEPLGSERREYRVLDDEDAGRLFEAVREVAMSAVEGVRSGIIEPRPERSCPSWCELGPVCRARRGGHRW